jgi:hypothetical protein
MISIWSRLLPSPNDLAISAPAAMQRPFYRHALMVKKRRVQVSRLDLLNALVGFHLNLVF